MQQSKLVTIGEGKAIRDLYLRLESHFEDDGWPISIVELDEDADRHEVSVYIATDDASAEERVQAVAGDATFQREELPDLDWVALSLEGLQPVRAGRFLVHGAHDRDEIRADDIAIEIEAGQAFGTGHHGTTSGCLELIEDVLANESPASMLDLGTGSAVLAIALAKLSGRKVLATDIDPVATEVAQSNVDLNGVGDLVDCVTATGFDHPDIKARAPFDLIVANILALPLIELAPVMKDNVRSGGSIILSGILRTQGDRVVAAYEAAGFKHIKTLPKEEWVSFHLRR